MNTYTINVTKDFGRKPYGRYAEDGEWNGGKFRVLLAEKLRENEYVHVNLDGYNRYGRSFLDEAFGGLIREEGFTYEYLQEHLTYSHSLVKSIESLIDDRIQAAARNESER